MKKQDISEFERLVKTEYSNLVGIVVRKNGSLIYEKYFGNYTKDDGVHVASVTKSILSLLIGIAIDQGYINNVEQKVLDFFPDYTVKRGEKMIQHITLKDLLSMTAPYKYKSEPYTKVYSSEDWVKAALDLLGGKGDRGTFKYSTVGTHILSGILVNATGKSVIDFAKENVFKPLEIKVPLSRSLQSKEEHITFLKDKYVMGWVVDPKGVNTGGWGLTLTPQDMAKIGQLYLDKGIWKGKQLVSSKWVADSTSEKSRWDTLSYGYLWWLIDDCYAALGDGGNIIFISPKNKLVIAITSTFMPRAKDRIALIQTQVLPLFE